MEQKSIKHETESISVSERMMRLNGTSDYPGNKEMSFDERYDRYGPNYWLITKIYLPKVLNQVLEFVHLDKKVDKLLNGTDPKQERIAKYWSNKPTNDAP